MSAGSGPGAPRDDRDRLRRRNVVTAVVLALVALGFYVLFVLTRLRG